ncbi:Cmx/CmrA family chloramphenicol efflux MFS transporter [Kitasatospora sp. NPDC092286]|uniref:Cmx/CmrA family chloramphenicol efflux MFS transporter n=1 Tax=Kitasatospora sp. NPDC092286 TaxID=3364087 RepID=UPI0038160DF7
MPFVLYLLALAVFAQGTSEFMLSGLVPDLADDLQVSVPAAGALSSAFAAGMVVGAPLMAAVGSRWSQRRALATFLGAFLLVHVIGATTSSYPVLLACRVVAALGNAGFLAVALSTAVGLVAPNAKGRATAVLLGGTTMACVVGVPAGALLGQVWGWRAAFWAVAVVTAPALIAVLRSLPRPTADTAAEQPKAPSPRDELRALRRPRLVRILLLAALVNGATFCGFTYLAPLVTTVTAITPGWVPAVLALFGLGAFAGVTTAGRLADTRPGLLLPAGGAVLLTAWSAFAMTADEPVAALGLVLLLGSFSFAVGATLVAEVLYAAPDAPTLAGAFATAAFNAGATAGPLLGGTAIDAGLGYRSPLWVSAVLVAAALPLVRTVGRR